MGFFDILFESIFGDTGSLGEAKVHDELQSLFKNEQLFRNVYLRKRDGAYTEIDHIAVCQKGIFVLESKNYDGWIFGNDKHSQWTQTLPNGQKNKFFNPIWQNNAHINCLKYHFREYINLTYYSFIVFSNTCELKSIEYTTPNTHVIQRDDLFYKMKKINESATTCLTTNEMEQIKRYLSKAEKPNDTVKKQHLNDIKSNSTKCPLCKSNLKQRTNKSTGNTFYGCEAFPKCRYTTNSI